MRFLFGDSVPFEGGYDVLETLRLWVEASADLLETVDAIETRERGVGKRAQEQLHAINAVSGFYDTVVQRIVEEAARAGEPDLMAPHARELVERVEAMAAMVREQSAASLDGDQRTVAVEVESLVGTLSERLGEYLLTGPLPITGWELTLSYADGPASGRVSLHYPEAIDGRFALDLANDPSWSQPKRVGDVCPEILLEVGVKKAFLRSTLNPEVAPLDELFVTYLELGEDSMSLRLSRRPEQGETFLIIDADFSGDPAVGKIRRPGDGSETPHPSPRSDHAVLRKLFTALRNHAQPLTHHEGELETVRLDGEARPVRGDLTRELLSRIGARLAPTVLEVHAHSPNPVELSLKREHDDGRREELYLNNDELRERLAPVPDADLELFAGIPFLLEGRALPDAGTADADASAEPDSEPEPESDKPRLELAPADDEELASVEVDLEAELGESAEAPAETPEEPTAAEEPKAAEPGQPTGPRKPKAPRRPSAPPRRSERPSAVPPVAAIPKKKPPTG